MKAAVDNRTSHFFFDQEHYRLLRLVNYIPGYLSDMSCKILKLN